MLISNDAASSVPASHEHCSTWRVPRAVQKVNKDQVENRSEKKTKQTTLWEATGTTCNKGNFDSIKGNYVLLSQGWSSTGRGVQSVQGTSTLGNVQDSPGQEPDLALALTELIALWAGRQLQWSLHNFPWCHLEEKFRNLCLPHAFVLVFWFTEFL